MSSNKSGADGADGRSRKTDDGADGGGSRKKARLDKDGGVQQLHRVAIMQMVSRGAFAAFTIPSFTDRFCAGWQPTLRATLQTLGLCRAAQGPD